MSGASVRSLKIPSAAEFPLRPANHPSMKIALLCLLLTLSALARTPAEVVQDAFAYDLKHGMSKTLQNRSHCFTPGFLRLFRRALALPAPAVDMDYFTASQDGGHLLKIAAAQAQGKEAIVQVKLWQGAYRGAPAGPEPAVATTKVYLTDLGQGFQIWDIVHQRGGTTRKVSAREDFKNLLAGKQLP